MRKQSGFTLLEMLAAILIFTMFSVAMLMAIIQQLTTLKKSQVDKRGSILARSLIEEHLTCPVGLGSHSGKTGGFSWTLSVDSPAEQGYGLGIFRAHLIIQSLTSARNYDGAFLCKTIHPKHEA